MDDKSFYNRILEDSSTYDKVLYDLDLMIVNAPNARIRTQAELAKTYLVQVQQICVALKNHNGA